MPQDNAELVRRSVEAFSGGDLDTVLETWAPDAVWDWSNSHGFDAGVFHGHDEIRSFAEGFLGTFDEVRVELDSSEEVADGLVIAENVAHFRGRDGIRTQARSAWLISIRDGMQRSLTLFQTKGEARRAAGVDESGGASEKNLEIVRRMYDAFGTGDAAAALAYFAADVVIDASHRVDGRVGHGREELAAIFAEWMGTWDDWREEVEEMRDAGGHVLVISTQRGRGKGSGVEWESRFWMLYELAAGKIRRWTIFDDPAKAREAAGLAEHL